jgi:LDH2 family malate/lactate/ureidoglycolate dehydrogenase
VTVDMSTGAVSVGKILDYRAKNLPLPDGWAVDASGVPTTDAAAAAAGAISPFGGPKGYALGLAFGAMVGALTGTAFGPDVYGTLDVEHQTTKGDVIVAFDAATFAGADMRDPLGGYLDLVRASGTGAPVTIPGDRARTARAERLRDGVEIATDVWEQLDRGEEDV